MAVLMSYHKLVERDAKNIDVHWKAASIILLVIAIATSFAVSFSLHRIMYAFDEHCVLNAKVDFYQVPQASLDSQSSSSTASSGSSSEASSSSNITANLNEMSQYKISVNSKWGKRTTCDYGIYIPICQSCFGIIMTVMFIICGKGGKSEPNSFLPQPWRIVTPAIVFFLVMTILSIVHLVIVQGGMRVFCECFKQQMPHTSCDDALNHFKMPKKTEATFGLDLPPGVFHKLLTGFDYAAFGLWLTSLLLLLARIIFVIDFQLVRVTVKTVEYENAKKSSTFKVKDPEEEEEDKDDADSSFLSIISVKYQNIFEDIGMAELESKSHGKSRRSDISKLD